MGDREDLAAQTEFLPGGPLLLAPAGALWVLWGGTPDPPALQEAGSQCSASVRRPSSPKSGSNMPGGNYYDEQKAEDVAMSGLLDKQSPSMFKVSWQQRYCVLTISDKCFRYFKNESDATEAGVIDISKMQATGPGEQKDTCTTFAIQMQDRTFAFEAPSHEVMLMWINNIACVKAGKKPPGGLKKVAPAPASASASASGASPTPPTTSARTMSANDFVKYGYLNKQSHNKLVLNWQRRYVEIAKHDNVLHYYKQEPPLCRTGREEIKGSIVCEDIEWIKPKGDTGGVTINKETCGNVFEIMASDLKVYTFEAVDSEEMFEWILAIEQLMALARRGITQRLARCKPAADKAAPAAATGGGGGRGSNDSDDSGRDTNLTDDSGFGSSLMSSNSGAVVSAKEKEPIPKVPVPAPAPKPVYVHKPLPETFYMRGLLGKQSPNKFRITLSKYQKRFVTISKHDSSLRYYDDEKTANSDVCPDVTEGLPQIEGKTVASYVNPNKKCLGCGDIREAEFVRSFDATPECTIFELGFHDRTFVFDAGTVTLKNEWIKAVETVIAKSMDALRNLEKQKLELLIPEIVRTFDKIGVTDFQAYVKTEMIALYPPAWSEDIGGGADSDDADLAKHVAGAQAIMKWLDDKLPAVRKSATKPARYDIMAVLIDAVNRYLDMRLMIIIGEPDSDVMQNANTADVYAAIIAITGYQQKLNKVYCPVFFRTSSTAGTRMSTNIRYTTTNFRDDSMLERDSADSSRLSTLHENNESVGKSVEEGSRFDSDGYRPQLSALEEPEDEEEKGVPIISAASSGCSITVNAAGIPVYKFHCEFFEKIPELCERYVEGSFVLGSRNPVVLKPGTGQHLEEHCNKVWEKMLRTPTDFVHRHQDGTFYTETPTLMWQCLHQHLQLAVDAHSSLLHIRVADKISLALNKIIRITTSYVATMDTQNDSELREMELEFICALINDNALHIEEVITLVESFENEEVRDKVNDSFDAVTEQLVRCGQACLTRLVTIIMADMAEQFNSIYSEENWLNLENGDSGPVTIIAATVRDYMSDFEEFLMPFWYSKFSSMIVEEVIIKYINAILKHSGTDEPEDAVGDMLTFGRISKDVNELNQFLRKAMPETVEALKERETSRHSQLEQWEIKAEVAEIEEFEVGKKATIPQIDDINEDNEYLLLTQLANELNFYLTSSYDKAASHAMSRISAFPSSAEAIRFFFLACCGLREDLDEDELDECDMFIQPAMHVAPNAAQYNEKHSIAEGRLGALYDALWAISEETPTNRDSGFGVTDALAVDGSLRASTLGKGTGNTMTHQKKMMTNVPLKGLKESLRAAVQSVMQSEGHEEEVSEAERASMTQKSRLDAANKSKTQVLRRGSLKTVAIENKKRVEQLMEILEEQEEDESDMLAMDEQEDDEVQSMEIKLASLQFSLEGTMDKRSPSSKMWQQRFFRIITRKNDDIVNMSVDDEGLVDYIILWYKKKGDSVLKSFNTTRTVRMQVLESPRELGYIPEINAIQLYTEAVRTGLKVHKIGIVTPNSSSFVFNVVAGPDPTGRDTELHELTLRVKSVDELTRWLMAFVKCGNLSYIENSAVFAKSCN